MLVMEGAMAKRMEGEDVRLGRLRGESDGREGCEGALDALLKMVKV